MSALILTSLRPDLCPDSKEIGLVVTTGFHTRTILSLLPVTTKLRLILKKQMDRNDHKRGKNAKNDLPWHTDMVKTSNTPTQFENIRIKFSFDLSNN